MVNYYYVGNIDGLSLVDAAGIYDQERANASLEILTIGEFRFGPAWDVHENGTATRVLRDTVSGLYHTDQHRAHPYIRFTLEEALHLTNSQPIVGRIDTYRRDYGVEER